MFLSVRVERVSELPNDEVVSIEFRADGTVVFYLDGAHITAVGAEALQTIMASARGAYHQAWDLPAVAAAALAS
jgi:hypothetical protein